MNQYKAIVCGYYGKGNTGDEALLLSLLQMLPEQITPIVLSANPSLTNANYGVTSIPRRSPFSLVSSLNKSDLFIWGGGSLIQDVTSFASPYYYLGLMALAQKMQLKTFAWAQGIGPIKAKITKKLTTQILAKCTGVSVRDYASAELLNTWQIPAIVAPDPVWALKSKPVPELWETRAPRVAVSLRPCADLTPKRLQILTHALNIFQKSTDVSLIFVPFQPEKDLAIAKQVTAQLSGNCQIIYKQDPRSLKGLFRGIEMLIGMRYHSLIMAASQECRCFALSYDPKVTQLQTELNLSGWELTNLPDDPDEISTAWLQEYVNGDCLDQTRIESLIERAELHQQIFFKR